MRNRIAVAIGALAVAAFIGGYALWNNSHKSATTQDVSDAGLEQVAPVTATPNDQTTSKSNMTGGADSNKQGSTDAKTQENKAVTTVPESYEVKLGDTLRTIAQKFYGDPNLSSEIERLNQLDNPNVIKVGLILQMPHLDGQTPATTTPAKTDGKADKKADKKAETKTEDKADSDKAAE